MYRVNASHFQPLITYVEDVSELHACKIFNVETNKHVFHNFPLLWSKMYTALQETDLRVLQLCYVEGDAAWRKKFGSKMDAIAGEASALTPLMEKISMWQDKGNTFEIALLK